MVLAEYHQDTHRWQITNIFMITMFAQPMHSAKTMFTPTMFSRGRPMPRDAIPPPALTSPCLVKQHMFKPLVCLCLRAQVSLRAQRFHVAGIRGSESGERQTPA